MKFLIRDDDPCYFTKVSELEECYSEIYSSVPVCFSITPFRIAGKYFQTQESIDTEKPIHENKELLEYLKIGYRKGYFDFAIHGYNHIYHNDTSRKERVPEYAVSEGLINRTADAKKYLEETMTVKLNTFVPPSNSLSFHGYKAIVRNKLNVVHKGSFRPSLRPLNVKNIPNYIKCKTWVQNHRMNYPFVLDFKSYKELHSFNLYPSTVLADLIAQLKLVYEHDGVFALATHYHAFNKKIKSGETIKYALNKILEEVHRLKNVEFIRYKDLW